MKRMLAALVIAVAVMAQVAVARERTAVLPDPACPLVDVTPFAP
jgi:hypothetical protein